MSILGSQAVTKQWLSRNGFKKDGWGSPYTRRMYDTTCYIRQVDITEYSSIEIIFFPKGFEGYVTAFHMGHIASGKSMLEHDHVMILGHYWDALHAPFIKVDDVNDIITFFNQVVDELSDWHREEIRNKVKWL